MFADHGADGSGEPSAMDRGQPGVAGAARGYAGPGFGAFRRPLGLGKSRHRGPNPGLPLPPSDFGVRGVLPWIVIIWSGSARVTVRATAGCGRISTMLPPCPLRVLATSNRSDIAAESAKRKPDTSIISCRVISDSWEVITPLSCVIVLISATPDNTISGPDAPAATDVWSKLTAPYIPPAKRTHYPDTHDFEAGVGWQSPGSVDTSRGLPDVLAVPLVGVAVHADHGQVAGGGQDRVRPDRRSRHAVVPEN